MMRGKSPPHEQNKKAKKKKNWYVDNHDPNRTQNPLLRKR